MKNVNIKKVTGVDPLFQIAWIRSKECNNFAKLKKTLKYANKSFSVLISRFQAFESAKGINERYRL